MENSDNSIKFSSFYKKQQKEFERYFPESMPIFCPDAYPKNLKKRNQRVCRFCNKSMPETTFKNDSHVFPKALGNQFLISDFECDKCNVIFSRYEDDLTKYLGLSRTFSKIRGRKVNPEFISKDIIASKTIIFESEKVIKVENKNPNKRFSHNPENLRQTINYTKQPYVPVNVFKALYKMALSIMPEAEINEYYLGLEFLKPNFGVNFKTGLMIHEYRLPNPYEFTSGWLFRGSTNSTTRHSFILLYDYFMLQILLPFNQNDLRKPKNLLFPACPPFFDGSGDEQLRHNYERFIEMSSNISKSDDEENLIIEFNREDNTAVYDPKIDQFVDKSKFDFDNIVGLYILNEDFSYKPKG